MALNQVGFAVEILCPGNHPVHTTKFPKQTHKYSGLWPLTSLRRAIERAHADLIIPGDDLAVRHLHRLDREERTREGNGSSICQLIEHSIGAKEGFPIISARTAFISLAQQEGLVAPATAVIGNLDDLTTWSDKHGFPFVLKADESSGGEGVRIVTTAEKAERAYKALAAPPLLARAAKRTLVNRDCALLVPSLVRQASLVNAQDFIAGRESTTAVVCWKGAVLASLQFEVLKTAKDKGHATVLRTIENRDISRATEVMVKKLGLSGLHGFDFMVEAETGKAHLIEMNPRATQIGHFRMGAGRDLPGALYTAVSGQTASPSRGMTENDTIALFPNEWKRDANSPFLTSGYHDVPWEEKQLVRACVLKSVRSKSRPLPAPFSNLLHEQIHSGDSL
jgi:hypothetical protein